MALKDKNFHENKRNMNVIIGGNGDYSIQIRGKDYLGEETIMYFEVCTSGGYAPSSVKIAVAELYRALEAEGLNEVEYE